MTGDCEHMGENGHCSAHGVEIERRRTSDKRVEDLKADIERHSGHFKDIFGKLELAKEFRGQAKVGAVIFMGIFVGSFLYTKFHKDDAAIILAKLEQDIESNEDEIHDIRGDLKVVNANYSNILSTINRVDSRLTQLVDMLDAEGRITKVRIEDAEGN